MMQSAKLILLAVFAVILAAYAIDCGATTPEQAMQCCNSMPCSSRGHHGQECCQTMPTIHDPFVRPSTAHDISLGLVVFAALATPGKPHGLDSSAQVVAAYCGSPPLPHSAVSSPLRI